MKTKKITSVLFIIAIVTVCALNVQKVTKMSENLGYSSLSDMITLSVASANEIDEIDTTCVGSTCDNANGYSYSTHMVGKYITCCGVLFTLPGNKIS